MKKRTITICAVALAVVLAFGIGAYAASNFGTSADPLITLSYIDETLKPDLLNQLQTELDSSLSTSSSFELVSLTAGQTLTGGVGCEIILRSGTATVAGSLLDSTNGTALSGGSTVSANHLCLVDNQGGVLATANCTLLVRGSYTKS